MFHKFLLVVCIVSVSFGVGACGLLDFGNGDDPGTSGTDGGGGGGGDADTGGTGDVDTSGTGDVDTSGTGDADTSSTGDVDTSGTGDADTSGTGDADTSGTTPGTGGGSPAIQSYSVSGTVLDASGDGVPEVVLSFDGYGTATTASDGSWQKSGIEGSVSVSAAKSGWTFSPTTRTVTGAATGITFYGSLVLGDASVVVVSGSTDPNPTWAASMYHDRVQLDLKNEGGPGWFKVQFWGLPTSPNGPNSFYGETEAFEVPAGYREVAVWDVYTDSTSITVPSIDWVIVLTRNQGSVAYRQTAYYELSVDNDL